VHFYDNGVGMGAKTLSLGKATTVVASLAAGTHLISATYAEAGNPSATSIPVVVDVELAMDPAHLQDDADGDGIPNSIELAESRNPITKDNDIFANARLFSMQQYRDFLGREGEAAGVDFWTGRVASGAVARQQVIESFFGSAEFQGSGAPIVRLYFAYFLRIPDYDGLVFGMNKYRTGTSIETISDFFATSAEFVATYGNLSNPRFLDRVYANVLGRAPDTTGYNFWLSRLNNNQSTRGQVMLAFSESPEYRGQSAHEIYVTMAYVGMLRRSPEQEGFDFWVGYMDSGKTGLDLIYGFLTSTEYRARFLP
jgi:hypothetical protein